MSKFYKKYWKGALGASFVSTIHTYMVSQGFNEEKKEVDDCGFIVWYKEIQLGRFSVTLVPGRFSQDLEFDVTLGFDSNKVQRIENQVKPWTCDPEFADSTIDALSRIANINFYIFSRFHNRENIAHSYRILESDREQNEQKLMADLGFAINTLQPYFEDENLLADELLKLGHSDQRQLEYGLSSANAFKYAALLKFLTGHTTEAIEALDAGAEASKREWENNYIPDPKERQRLIDIDACRFSKFKEYILAKSGK